MIIIWLRYYHLMKRFGRKCEEMNGCVIYGARRLKGSKIHTQLQWVLLLVNIFYCVVREILGSFATVTHIKNPVARKLASVLCRRDNLTDDAQKIFLSVTVVQLACT